jgi:hypothetical protein
MNDNLYLFDLILSLSSHLLAPDLNLSPQQ